MPFGTFPKIHPFWCPHLSLIGFFSMGYTYKMKSESERVSLMIITLQMSFFHCLPSQVVRAIYLKICMTIYTQLSYYLGLKSLCIIRGIKQDRDHSQITKQLQLTPILATIPSPTLQPPKAGDVLCDICYQKLFKCIFVTNYKGGPILLAIVKKSPQNF